MESQTKIRQTLCLLLILAGSISLNAAPAAGPLRVHPKNPRYFTDGTTNRQGDLNAVYLTGSHTWFNMADSHEHPAFDFKGYLDFLDRYNHNFNVQGIDADTNKDGSGAEAYDLSIAKITDLEDAFVRKAIDAVNDLDNVLFEIGNEGDVSSIAWQHHVIELIKTYEAGKPKRHPVGMTGVFNILDGSWAPDDGALLASAADWISPAASAYKGDPPVGDGRKVIIADVDHIWPAAPHQGWVWRCFLRGLHPILMDQYSYGDPKWTSVDEQEAMRRAMGDTLRFAKRVNLATMVPSGKLCSSGYCLANAGTEYLVYQPKAGEVISLELKAGAYQYEWFEIVKGKKAGEGSLSSIGGREIFKPPIEEAIALYVYRNQRQ